MRSMPAALRRATCDVRRCDVRATCDVPGCDARATYDARVLHATCTARALRGSVHSALTYRTRNVARRTHLAPSHVVRRTWRRTCVRPLGQTIPFAEALAQALAAVAPIDRTERVRLDEA